MKISGVFLKNIIINNDLVSWRLIENQVVFFHKGERKLYELNKTASFIWKQMNGKTPIGDIINKLFRRFKKIKKNKLQNDTISFIKRGLEKKIFIIL